MLQPTASAAADARAPSSAPGSITARPASADLGTGKPPHSTHAVQSMNSGQSVEHRGDSGDTASGRAGLHRVSVRDPGACGKGDHDVVIHCCSGGGAREREDGGVVKDLSLLSDLDDGADGLTVRPDLI